jgi:hypothetical protein
VATLVQHMTARLRTLSRTSATIRHFLANGAPVLQSNSAS